MPTFADLADEYKELWDTMVIRDEKIGAVTNIAQKLIGHKSQYLEVQKSTGVPWFVIAALHNRESDANFNTYLGNGQSLNRVTTIVPKGRGPFDSWHEGAIDALKIDKLDQVKDWTPERACFEIEKFNGFGYQNKGIPSPYLWSFSNHYTKGKYVADGQFSSTTVDQQCGAIPILRRIMELDKSATFKTGGKVTGPVVVTGTGGATGVGFIMNGYVKTGVAIIVAAAVIAGIVYFIKHSKDQT